ncbi:hypothetical protein [Pseudoroseomonas cervicalis]|uniref:hypothetical protein n=1 Tax=Teichococcus cervicalis TaxID=204525 RepID=UPI00278088A8|nr:hypothetical protein [Pseudoroseomonas cervicalis]MDQ1078352.1 hypothetical protein [Pseudoroseomonas cervicalis]
MQHFRRLAATIVVAGLTCLAPAAGPFGAATAQAQPSGEAASGDAYTQRGVPAEATAENAVIARTRALAAAQRTAYDRMADALGLPKGLSDSQIDQMVSSIIVEEERSSRTGYSGRLTVNFNPNRVGGPGRAVAGGGSGSSVLSGAAPATGDAAPPVTPSILSAPANAYLETQARFGSLREWLELRRRLRASPEIASVDVVAIAVDGAQLRLGLRRGPGEAAQALQAGGIALLPPAAAQPGTPPGGGIAPPVRWGGNALRGAPAAQPASAGGGAWQVGLAGRG